MIETQRLTLTPWDVAGLEAFMRVTNTPEVMEFLGGVQSRDRFEAFLGRLQASQRDNGFCLWLARRKADDAVLGFCGLKRGSVGPIDGKIEIGWRLGRDRKSVV